MFFAFLLLFILKSRKHCTQKMRKKFTPRILTDAYARRTMTCQVCQNKNLQINPFYDKFSSYLDKSYCNEKLKNHVVMHRDVPVALLRCYFICRCLDKSDRIDIEKCSAFHSAAVSSNIFKSDIAAQ